MSVKVCDALMGSGKTESAITYMNEHSDDKFIFITPYLNEAKRIRDGCPKLKFVEPSNKYDEYDHRKLVHTMSLIKSGRNIATTHQAFKRYNSETLNDIRNQGYTLIIDENVDVLERFDFSPDDIQIAVDAGYITYDNGAYALGDKEYGFGVYKELFNLLRDRKLMRVDDGTGNYTFFWNLPPELITSFKDVIILTYLFEGQSLHHMLKIHGIPYDNIGVERTNAGGFRFCDKPGYIPEYADKLSSMIHILDNDKINSVGDDFYSLSMNWFDKNLEEVNKLKKNVTNYFINMCPNASQKEKLWGSYKTDFGKIKGKGYTNSFLIFNAKATNEYRKCKYLAYVVNPFMNVGEKIFYESRGIEVNEDEYALSVMIQWIWRSAIRDGNEIYIYVPSKRMRNLLIQWMDNISVRKEDDDNA